ncbi:MAG: YraN family protein [Planctomycetota bacterium]
MTIWSRLTDRLPRRPHLQRSRGKPGPRGEAVAARFLRRHRYRILRRNARNRFGEVDLLALAPDRRTLVLVEVKSRELTQPPPTPNTPQPVPHDQLPEWRVTHHKERRLNALAAQLARQHRWTNRPWRFDVIGVDLPPKPHKPVIRHHPAAFESHV